MSDSPGRSEIRDGMCIDWDVPIRMDDGVVLRADVFRPTVPGTYPAIMSYGCYGKGLAFQDGYPSAWEYMEKHHPDALAGSSNLYQNWEVVDPEKWVPDGYACIRVDSRGCGRSPGVIDHHSPRETRDFYECIEWAARQAWCSGKVGLAGISYYAMNQWRVAALASPHLAAICVWEGYNDRYREGTHHGGILTSFPKNWQHMQVRSIQHGIGERGPRCRLTGELVAGPDTLSEEELAANRADMWSDILDHPLDDDYYKRFQIDWSAIIVPLLSAANWGGQGLHLRGNIEGYLQAGSKDKWLEVHGGAHWAEFYTDYGVGLQKRFFGHFLKGLDTGWDRQPAVQLNVRHVDHFELRHENEWPLPQTSFVKAFLDPQGLGLLLGTRPKAVSMEIGFDALGDGLTFLTPSFEHEAEITGPIAVKLFVSSSTTDADLFVVLRLFDRNADEVVFQGALDPHTPVAQGWLRASHRRLDPAKSLPYRPYHSHDRLEPLTPGQVVELDIEVWPTSIVVPVGYRLGLSIRGRDYEWRGPEAKMSNMRNPMRGCGPFVHDEPQDRPVDVFGGRTTLHFNPLHESYVLLPIIARGGGACRPAKAEIEKGSRPPTFVELSGG